jgi:hypothetical protein
LTVTAFSDAECIARGGASADVNDDALQMNTKSTSTFDKPAPKKP